MPSRQINDLFDKKETEKMWISGHTRVSKDAALDRSVLLKDAVYEISFTATDERIKYLEHVEVVGSIEMWKRGCLEARIISPSGKECNLQLFIQNRPAFIPQELEKIAAKMI